MKGYTSDALEEYYREQRNYKPGEEDDQSSLLDGVYTSATNPAAIISSLGKFTTSIWEGGLGWTAYGNSPEESFRRARALQNGDIEEYNRRDA